MKIPSVVVNGCTGLILCGLKEGIADVLVGVGGRAHNCTVDMEDAVGEPNGVAACVRDLATGLDDAEDTAGVVPRLEGRLVLDEARMGALSNTPILDHGAAAHIVGHAARAEGHGGAGGHRARHEPRRAVLVELAHREPEAGWAAKLGEGLHLDEPRALFVLELLRQACRDGC